MYKKRTPRIEFTSYLPEIVVGQPIEPDALVTTLPLKGFTLKALDDAGIETVSDAMELLKEVAGNADVDLPKGIGKSRLKEIEAAIYVPASSGPTPKLMADLIFGACETVARRCGTKALYHSGEILEHEGKSAVRIRWSTGMDHRALLRKVKLADKHFHASPLRRKGPDPITEILD